MNKTTLTAIAFLFAKTTTAQPGAAQMIKAEKDFAAYSVAHSTKEAFLQVIDSNSIMFDKGKPVKAVDFWNEREKNTGVLNWRPQYIEISGSGNFGYTTGPWTFRPSPADSVVASGQYTTVWYINKKGEWNFLVDYGIDNNLPGGTNETVIDAPKQPDTSKAIPHIAYLVSADRNFTQLLGTNKGKAYELYLSANSILSRNGLLPAVTHAERKVAIDATPSGIKYTFSGWGQSPGNDMGYTFGTAEVNGKTENYLRIWRLEKKGWRIAVEVIRY